MKSTNNSQETIVKTKNAAITMATFHTRKNNLKSMIVSQERYQHQFNVGPTTQWGIQGAAGAPPPIFDKKSSLNWLKFTKNYWGQAPKEFN